VDIEKSVEGFQHFAHEGLLLTGRYFLVDLNGCAHIMLLFSMSETFDRPVGFFGCGSSPQSVRYPYHRAESMPLRKEYV
jgi:hypothetical protein